MGLPAFCRAIAVEETEIGVGAEVVAEAEASAAARAEGPVAPAAPVTTVVVAAVAVAVAVATAAAAAAVAFATAAAAAAAVVPTPSQPCRFFKCRFMWVVRLSTLWHTGHCVVPLCMFMCLYIESRFQNVLPQILHECDGCSMTTVRESKSDINTFMVVRAPDPDIDPDRSVSCASHSLYLAHLTL